MSTDLDRAARALYEGMANKVKPAWDDLGDACQSVWRERVEQAEEDAAHALMRDADDAWARDNWPPTAEEIDRTYFASRDASPEGD
jgi:hypothetical protein